MGTKDWVVLLDNGHGRETPGKASPDGALQEWEWTRAMAVRVEMELKRAGIECERLVPEVEDVPLIERVSRANRAVVGAKRRGMRAVLVSLHCNASGDGKRWMAARGWQVHTANLSPGAPTHRLASCLAKAMQGEFVSVRMPGAGQLWWVNDFYILAHTACPAVLTENLFMDNREDCRRLLSEEWQDRLARAHAAGLAQFIAGDASAQG